MPVSLAQDPISSSIVNVYTRFRLGNYSQLLAVISYTSLCPGLIWNVTCVQMHLQTLSVRAVSLPLISFMLEVNCTLVNRALFPVTVQLFESGFYYYLNILRFCAGTLLCQIALIK